MRAFLLFTLVLSLAAGDKLLFVQTLFRHGLRTPAKAYPNDPYQEAFWGVPWGELTTQGMAQQFEQGKRLRKMYMEDTGLVGANYSRYETYIRSADFPRCSQSAQSNFAGLYAGSATYPLNVVNWPSNWTPVPVHTVPHDEDYVLEGHETEVCPQYVKSIAKRSMTREFEDFVASQWKLLHIINTNTGNPPDHTYNAIAILYATLSVEKSFNLAMPDWVTEEFYDELEAANNAGFDYVHGEAGFGLQMDPEMIKLSTGFLLKEWVDNIKNAINGTSTVKYYAYSGHDITITNLLVGLGVKQTLIGPSLPDYASTVACELWDKEGELYVKMMFSPNSYADFAPFTGMIQGCGAHFCPLQQFLNIIESFIATDVKICDVGKI